MTRVGRNDPCPCGSGRKLKVCCGPGAHGDSGESHVGAPQGRFRYEAGAYAVPGGFLPSIACLMRDEPDGWRYHFVLVTTDTIWDEEDRAALEADEHLARAFQGDPAPEIVAMRLKQAGHVRLTDFRVLGPRSEGEPELPSNADAGH